MSNINYRSDIDGLRAVAVISVILYHLNFTIFSGGFVGVDIFFVISGFVITAQIVKLSQANNFSFLNFYHRRARRILPAVFFLILCTSIFSIISLYPDDYRKFFSAAKKVILLIPNFYFARNTNYFEPGHETSPLLHTWSLGVEEQFYLLYPLILILGLKKLGFNKSFFLLTFILLSTLGLSEYLTIQKSSNAFYMVYSRAWEFAIGGLLAFNLISSIKNKFINLGLAITGLLLIIYSVFVFDNNTIFPGLSALYPCVGTALIIYTGNKNYNIIHRLLSLKPLVFTGLISYSLYLWHWPLIAFYSLINKKDPGIFISIIIIILAYLIAYFSWRYIEKPFRYNNKISRATLYFHNQHKKNHANKSFNIIDFNKIATICYSISAIIIFPIVLNTIGSQYKSNWRIYNNKIIYNQRNNEVDHSPIKDYQAVLIGDSHAVHYYPAVKQWAAKYNITVKLLTQDACPGVLGDFTTDSRPQEIKSCKRFIKKSEELIRKNKNIKLVILASRQDRYTKTSRLKKQFTESLTYTIDELKKLNKYIVILEQVPLFKNPPFHTTVWDKLFAKNRKHSGFANIDYNFINIKLSYSRKLNKELVQKYNIELFDPIKYITSAEYQGQSIYFDNNHLNKYGSEYITQFMRLPILEEHIAANKLSSKS